MISPVSPTATDAPQLYLDVSSSSIDRFWQQHPSPFSTDGIRWTASLNQICIDALLPWVREAYAPRARTWTNPATLPSVWEVVNGTALTIDQHRMVLIPTTASDFEEMRVPQEWVDLPSWAGEYYVSVYVNPDDQEVGVLGYATHQTLKQHGQFDSHDRTYSLEADSLIADLNVLWTTRRLCPQERLRHDLAPLPSLPLEQADALIERLGNASIVVPRLAVPFPLWGALMEHGGWRQRLYQKRLGLPEPWSVQQWLHTGISDFAQQLGWGTMNLQPNLARGSTHGSNGASAQGLVRQLTIAGKPYEFRVFRHSEDVWRFELQAATIGSLIPGGFKLRLLTEDLMPFENNEDVATTAIDQLYLEVRLSPGDALVWEIEPVPEAYDREILRF
jgi:hypothetical protein